MGDKLNTDAHTSQDAAAELVNSGDKPGAIAVLPSVALAKVAAKVAEYRRNTRAESTQTAYDADWKRFREWASPLGVSTLPASPEVVCAHLVWLAEEGYGLSSIERFLAAVVYHHKLAGEEFFRGARAVAETMEGVRRRVGAKRVKKAPLGIGVLTTICERLHLAARGLSGAELIGNLRHRAMLTTGWYCMLRSANLVAIHREHVRLVRFEGDEWVDDVVSPAGLIVHLPDSKTDQRKEGRDVAVHMQANEAVCPVRAMAAYLSAAGVPAGERIFPVSRRYVSRLVKQVTADPRHEHSIREIDKCPSCSVAARQFASHSLRRGAATTHAKRGVAEREIMRQGGWKSERVMRGYIEYATLFENNPTLATAAPIAPTPSPAPAPPRAHEAHAPRSAHERALNERFSGLLEEDPEVGKKMATVRDRIATGFYSQWLVDAFFQNYGGRKPTLAESYGFGELYASYMHGEICVFHVELRSGPFADERVSSNQAVLDGLPPLFRAAVAGGAGDDDGSFEWSEELGVSRFTAADGARSEVWRCAPKRLPLEVGYTAVSKTFEHVVAHGGVARWPYGHSMLIVLVSHPTLRERLDLSFARSAAPPPAAPAPQPAPAPQDDFLARFTREYR